MEEDGVLIEGFSLLISVVFLLLKNITEFFKGI